MFPIRAVFVIMYGKQNENDVKMKNIRPDDCIIYEHQSKYYRGGGDKKSRSHLTPAITVKLGF